MTLKINVYSYPEKEFLGQRFLETISDEKGNYNFSSEDINRQVNEVRALHNKNEKNSIFKTELV